MNEDWDLLARARRGDNDAWRTLMERHHARLSAMVLLITGCPDRTRDHVQECCARLLDMPIRHQRGTVGGLLTTIAWRLAVKDSGLRKRLVSGDGPDPPDPAPSPLDQVLKSERERWVAAAIRHLDEAHRHVLILRFYGDRSYAEIAKLMGIPLGTVKSRMFHAVLMCRTYLREKGMIE